MNTIKRKPIFGRNKIIILPIDVIILDLINIEYLLSINKWITSINKFSLK